MDSREKLLTHAWKDEEKHKLIESLDEGQRQTLHDIVKDAVWDARIIYSDHPNTPFNKLRPVIKNWVSEYLKKTTP